MQNVMTRILEWGKTLPYWEQLVLDKLIAGDNFLDEDYNLILEHLLCDEGLSERNLERETPRFYQFAYPESNPKENIKIKKISNLRNINALAENQTITFSEKLTAIFGQNGSGKSGYARVLASAAFTRGDREVLPNVTTLSNNDTPQSAEILIEKNGIEKVINYNFRQRVEDLASFYVFDSTSVRVHMNEQNPLSFSPAGLEYLKQLSDVTDEIRRRLNKKIEQCCQDCEFANLFLGESEVSRIIGIIGPNTDLNKLKELATISQDELDSRNELSIQIANFELDKTKEQVSEISSHISALENYSRTLNNEMDVFSEEKLEFINKQISIHNELAKTSDLASKQVFSNKKIKNIGSPEWQKMIKAAHNLALLEGKDVYPGEGDICLLCQQPLSDKANHLLHEIWEFLSVQTHDTLKLVTQSLDHELEQLRKVDLLTIENDLPVIKHLLGEKNSKLINNVEYQIKEHEQRFAFYQDSILTRKPSEFNPHAIKDPRCLDQFIEDLRTEKSKLENFDMEEVIELETKKRELDHRQLLKQLYEQIEDYVLKRRWAQDAQKAGGSTHHITSKHNEFFKELVTNEYIRIFEQNLKAMGRPLKVKISTIGKKGQTLKQITVESSNNAKELAKPEKVLSEGEKRAVALADFLTEAELDTTSNGIILDDPVTSLDLEWRETIAKLIIKLAISRQVIVFTHDLPFLYFLKENAEGEHLPLSTHWIKRGDVDGKPGYVFLDNSPALEKDYKKPTKARELQLQAKQAEAEHQEFLLREGFGALRTSYEAFIVFDMFESVVMRFNERISCGRLKDIRWDESLAIEVIGNYERLSRYIEGHLHSDEYSGAKPTPEMLEEEINIFANIQERLRAMKAKKREQ